MPLRFLRIYRLSVEKWLKNNNRCINNYQKNICKLYESPKLKMNVELTEQIKNIPIIDIYKIKLKVLINKFDKYIDIIY